MTEKTAGQLFRETLHQRWTARGMCIDTRPWEALPEVDREDLDAAAQAAIAARPADLTDLADWTELLREGNELRSQLAETEHQRDEARAETRQMQDAVHADLGQLLEVLGLGDYARPESPHEVFQQCVAKVRELTEGSTS